MMTCEKSRIRDLKKMWMISYVSNKGQEGSELVRRGQIEKQLLKFKTGERHILELFRWADERDYQRSGARHVSYVSREDDQ